MSSATATATATTKPLIRFGERELEMGGKYLDELRDCNAQLDDAAALRARLAEDGYLLIRGLHDPKAVLAARAEIFANATPGTCDPAFLITDGIIPAQVPHTGVDHGGDNTKGPAFRKVVAGERVMAFYAHLFSEPALTFDFKWMRLVGHKGYTGAHYDNVYMGRGSQRLVTMWTPFGSLPLDMGPLAILVGSHRLASYAKVRDTYGQMDVDRDRVSGWFENDPVDIIDTYGGKWATTTFEPGDALIFGMHSMHASLTNVTNRWRLTSDTRYQPAADPVDERWVGEKPIAHYGWNAGPQVSMETKRKEWGI